MVVKEKQKSLYLWFWLADLKSEMIFYPLVAALSRIPAVIYIIVCDYYIQI